MALGDHTLKVKKASVGITQVAGEMGVNAMSMLAGTTSLDGDVSRVLQLLNMVTPDELMDNDDYEGKPWHPFSPSMPDSTKTDTAAQKSAMMFRKSAKSSAKSCLSRSPDPLAAAGSRPVWARSTSSTRLQRSVPRLFGLWQVGSLPIAPWSRRTFLR